MRFPALGRLSQEKSTVQLSKSLKHSLRELCPDEELYSAALGSLYVDPEAQLPAISIQDLVADAEDALKRRDYKRAFLQSRTAFDKAVFEATRHAEEKGRYSKMAGQAISKTLAAAENFRPEDEFMKSLKILSRRLDDFINVAAAYYSEGPHR